jgi:lysophospholipase L1-like esterase
MSFYKEVPGRKTTLESTLKFDTTPTAGSTNPVTSGGVAEAVGGASDALQEQIDDIAEKAGSGYTPKGPASVATLNALSGQENGWLYTMTDAGTLTDGSLAVVAGDTVAWDATNSVWYKAMDYAPSSMLGSAQRDKCFVNCGSSFKSPFKFLILEGFDEHQEWYLRQCVVKSATYDLYVVIRNSDDTDYFQCIIAKNSGLLNNGFITRGNNGKIVSLSLFDDVLADGFNSFSTKDLDADGNRISKTCFKNYYSRNKCFVDYGSVFVSPFSSLYLEGFDTSKKWKLKQFSWKTATYDVNLVIESDDSETRTFLLSSGVLSSRHFEIVNGSFKVSADVYPDVVDNYQFYDSEISSTINTIAYDCVSLASKSLLEKKTTKEVNVSYCDRGFNSFSQNTKYASTEIIWCYDYTFNGTISSIDVFCVLGKTYNVYKCDGVNTPSLLGQVTGGTANDWVTLSVTASIKDGEYIGINSASASDTLYLNGYSGYGRGHTRQFNTNGTYRSLSTNFAIGIRINGKAIVGVNSYEPTPKTRNLVCIGDSITFGVGAQYSFEAWIYRLANQLVYENAIDDVVNNGSAGNTSDGIAHLVGGKTLCVTSAVTIPASGGVVIPVNAKLRDAPSGTPNGCKWACIDGIEGTITNSGDTYTFTRSESGSPRDIAEGTAILTEAAEKSLDNEILTIAIGCNDADQPTEEQSDTIIENVRRCVALSSTGKYIVIGHYTNHDTQYLIGKYRENFGSRFLDMYSYFAENGVNDAVALGILPSGDQSDWETLLLADGLHPNSAGHAMFAYYVHRKIEELGWI